MSLAGAVVTGGAVFRSRAGGEPRWLPADWQRRYNLLVIAQLGAIFLASIALGRTGHPEAIPVAVCVIAGVHFFPLADIFDLKVYRATALGLCLTGAIGAALLAVAGPATVRAVVGLGAAAVLWASAVRVTRPA